MKKFFSIILCLLILLSDQAKATVVFTDTFTVSSNINLNAYPSGSPDYAMSLGAATDLIVIASSDTVVDQVATDSFARIINPAVATGDQQITATLSGGGGTVGLMARMDAAGNDDGYLAFFNASGDSVRIYRVDDGNFVELIDCGSPGAFADPFTGRLKVTGSGATVFIEAQANATTTCTFSDTNANRKITGPPGIWNGTGSSISTFDNISVDNLASGSAVPLMLSKRRRVQ